MEEKGSFQEIVIDFLKKNWTFSLFIVIGLLLITYGIVQFSKPKSDGLEFTSGEDAVSSQSAQMQKIAVDIEGSVENPGVYSLSSQARGQDALVAAGGMNSSADRNYVSKNINLAQKLQDGQKIYIPSTTETASGTNFSASNSIVSNGTSAQGLININSATEASLDTLPKVGPVTAQKIINGRPYATINDLVSKKVLPQSTFDALKDLIIAQ